jgi:hypothetical protein
LVVLVVFGMHPRTAEGIACPVPVLSVQAARGGNHVVLSVPDNYEYVPSVMLDGGYRMWMCQGHYEGASPGRTYHGDQIAYATAPTPTGPWSTPVPVFRNSGDRLRFDGMHTCDPSVVRVHGRYYLYYGGHNDIVFPDPGYRASAIGVAVSHDGLSWTRLNGGRPIVTAVRDAGHPEYPALADARGYGAGQPSVTWLDGWFYLAYTDTTGYASNAVNGAGIYVLRSTDPTFQTNVQALVAPGRFEPRTSANATRYSLLEAFSVDWQYVDMLDAFAIADVTVPTAGKQIRVTLWDRSLATMTGAVARTAEWSEGPGLISRPDGHAVPAPTSCGRVPVDVLRSVGAAGGFGLWDLSHVGFDLATGLSCDCCRLPQVFEGTVVTTPGQPWALVVDRKRLHFQIAPPVFQLSKTVLSVPLDIYARIPAGPSMFAGAPVYYSDGTPGAFLLSDGRLWPASCYDLVVANQSSIGYIPAWLWAAHQIGPPLFCVR